MNIFRTKYKDETRRKFIHTPRGHDRTNFIRKAPKLIHKQKRLRFTHRSNRATGYMSTHPLIYPGKSPTTKDGYKELKKTNRYMKMTKDQGINFLPLYLDEIRLVPSTDVSFETADGMKIQLEYGSIMLEQKNNGNRLNLCSKKYNRIDRLEMVEEIKYLVLGFENAFIVKNLIHELFGCEIRLELMKDSKNIFNGIINDDQTANDYSKLMYWHLVKVMKSDI